MAGAKRSESSVAIRAGGAPLARFSGCMQFGFEVRWLGLFSGPRVFPQEGFDADQRCHDGPET